MPPSALARSGRRSRPSRSAPGVVRAAAIRSARRRSASSSQQRSAAPSAVASPGGHEEPGARAVGSPAQRLGDPADARGHHGDPARQRLGDDHPVGLGAGGEHEQVGAGVRRVEVGAGARSGEARPGGRSRPARPAVGAGRRSRARGRGSRRRCTARAGPRPERARRRRTSYPLAGVTAPTHSSSPPTAVPGARSSGSAPGAGDVHAAGGETVVVEHPGLRPVAGGDDGRDRREHRALARPARERGLAQRHVQQHDQPQPLGLGDDDLGGGRGDQPVDAAPVRRRGSRPGRRRGATRAATDAQGQWPATPCSWTCQPIAARPSQTRRS